jgi:SAM-dependent methyltransferase
MGFLIRIMKKVKRKFIDFRFEKKFKNNIDYWEERSLKLGRLAVMNRKHSEADIDKVTEDQIRVIFPQLKSKLSNREQAVLDYGCGIGRFSARLAELTKASVIAVDPIQKLLDMAPDHNRVKYSLMVDGKILVPENYFDLIWVCLVLGGIKESELNRVVSELLRVAKDDALFCIIENTSDNKDSKYWYYRSIAFYSHLLGFSLDHVIDYDDAGERISVFIGKRTEQV